MMGVTVPRIGFLMQSLGRVLIYLTSLYDYEGKLWAFDIKMDGESFPRSCHLSGERVGDTEIFMS